MANLKEIRAKVASIKSTQKDYSRDANGSCFKMRRAQERMAQGRPYADNMRRVIAHLVQATLNTNTVIWWTAQLSVLVTSLYLQIAVWQVV